MTHPLSPLRTLPRVAVLCCAFAGLLASSSLRAEGPASGGSASSPEIAKIEAHPASKVVKDYLQLMLQREWAKSATLVEPASLKQLLADYVKRLKAAPTMDDEAEMTQRVGKKTVEEVQNMAPIDFYVAYHQNIQDRYQIPPEVIKKVRDTLTLKLLSLAQEDDSHVHILVRTRHTNDKAIFESLELVSLVKIGDAWKVGLDEQTPRVTPIEGAAASPSPSAPAPDKTPDAPKPATPPVKPKPKTR